jgi:hypothetical protein
MLCVAVLFAARSAGASRLIAPLWDVWVVDEAGNPVKGIGVTVQHEDFGCEKKDHVETQFTDAKGHVQFAARYLNSTFKCATITTEKMVTFNKNRKRHARVFAGDAQSALVGNDLDKSGHLVDWHGTPERMRSRIVVHPRNGAAGVTPPLNPEAPAGDPGTAPKPTVPPLNPLPPPQG